jgi:hypothetical protein
MAGSGVLIVFSGCGYEKIYEAKKAIIARKIVIKMEIMVTLDRSIFRVYHSF